MKKYTLFVIVLSSPVIWTLAFNIPLVLGDWANGFENFSNKLFFFSSSKSLEPIFYIRHANIDSGGFVFLLSKFFYNRATFFIGEFLSFVSFFSPRFYFHAGDGTVFSPNVVEPIAFTLSPFWVYGLFLSIKEKRWRVIFFYIVFALIAYLVGKRDFSFLFLVLPFQFYFIYQGLLPFLSSRFVKIYLTLTAFYSLFLLGRLLVL